MSKLSADKEDEVKKQILRLAALVKGPSIDWGLVLTILQQILAILIPIFGPTPTPTPAPQPQPGPHPS